MTAPLDHRQSLSELGRRITDPPIAWLMKLALDRPELISLAAGFTDSMSLPVAHTRDLLERLLTSDAAKARSALQYGTGAGDDRLRQLTAERLRQQDGAESATGHDTSRLVMTHGSQQLLYLVSEALCEEGDIVLVEDPTYFVYLGIAQSRAIQCRGVRIDEQGVVVSHLEEVLEGLRKAGELPRLKALYLVTYFQNPTGTTTAIARKREALELLRRYEDEAGHPLYLLEDAAYRELRFAGGDEPSALGLPEAPERVIYTGTYSKPFATGIRVGYGILPRELFNVVMRLKGNHDFGTANLLQQILVGALESPIYEEHLAQLRQRYAHKAQVMGEALNAHCAETFEWRTPAGGLYYWAGTRDRRGTGIDSDFFKAALGHNVLYVPGALCYAEDAARPQPDHEMRLSFGSASEANITEGIRRLAG